MKKKKNFSLNKIWDSLIWGWVYIIYGFLEEMYRIFVNCIEFYRKISLVDYLGIGIWWNIFINEEN